MLLSNHTRSFRHNNLCGAARAFPELRELTLWNFGSELASPFQVQQCIWKSTPVTSRGFWWLTSRKWMAAKKKRIIFKNWTAVPRVEKYEIGGEAAVRILETIRYILFRDESFTRGLSNLRRFIYVRSDTNIRDWSLAYSFICSYWNRKESRHNITRIGKKLWGQNDLQTIQIFTFGTGWVTLVSKQLQGSDTIRGRLRCLSWLKNSTEKLSPHLKLWRPA